LPDLIVLDLMMPNVSGFDVTEAMRSDPATAGIPILVVTAKHVTREDREALNKNGGHVPIVAKSGFNHASFIAEVRRALAPAVENA
jgi:CheY-like chemotaxis protein